ncbi:uncharacterized protein LDX57_003198 [Aspergillus melleus]|uniref:uncharacterized protein n=1 Tax=Aspergillus melleus TaxID=138277 RepID=UPI001E8E08D6|nr:uncharacterized protein LDX57_003198 [Aspergillus melleus]KAH8425445.1 hypothetical protein LDX57_003198 [Aspergillus melleus]
MAEVLGILGSSIAVTQLASGVVGGIPKLRQLWREFRDLPRDIDDTLEELEILGQSLLVIQNSVKSNAANAASATIVERSLEFCQTATKDLDKLMMDLRIENQSTSVKRQKIKLQAIMQKSEIHDVRERLQRAVRYLNLAVNCYSILNSVPQ